MSLTNSISKPEETSPLSIDELKKKRRKLLKSAELHKPGGLNKMAI